MADFRIKPKTFNGVERVAVEKTTMSRVTLMTHDWTDPTTWYEESIYVTNEIANNTGDNQLYELSHNNIIDNYHGKISEEDQLVDLDGYSYRVSVTVNDSECIEQDPHYGTGGDYVVDYSDGYIEFTSVLNVDDIVKVTYHYENGSNYTIKPTQGKGLAITFTELQFSTDVIVNDSVHFDMYGYASVFAPQLGLPEGTKIKILGNTYKGMKDFFNDAVRSYPKMSAIGGPGWRGTDFDIVVLDWDYVAAVKLYDSYGMEIRAFLEHNIPIDGSFATTTFYCISEDENL